MTPTLDLRFVIGLFFTLVGLILLAAGFTVHDTLASGVASSTIDLVSGGAMLVFGLGMLLASHFWKTKR